MVDSISDQTEIIEGVLKVPEQTCNSRNTHLIGKGNIRCIIFHKNRPPTFVGISFIKIPDENYGKSHIQLKNKEHMYNIFQKTIQ